jgi:Ca2+-binding EF-hand superfamily protein
MKNDSNIVFATALLGFIGIASVGISQRVQANEANKNPAVTDQDLQTRQTEAHFKHLDRDGDGRVTQAELNANQDLLQHSEPRDYRIPLDSLDTNGDGVIAREEWNSRYYTQHGQRYSKSYRNGSWGRDTQREPPNR